MHFNGFSLLIYLIHFKAFVQFTAFLQIFYNLPLAKAPPPLVETVRCWFQLVCYCWGLFTGYSRGIEMPWSGILNAAMRFLALRKSRSFIPGAFWKK